MREKHVITWKNRIVLFGVNFVACFNLDIYKLNHHLISNENLNTNIHNLICHLWYSLAQTYISSRVKWLYIQLKNYTSIHPIYTIFSSPGKEVCCPFWKCTKSDMSKASAKCVNDTLIICETYACYNGVPKTYKKFSLKIETYG